MRKGEIKTFSHIEEYRRRNRHDFYQKDRCFFIGCCDDFRHRHSRRAAEGTTAEETLTIAISGEPTTLDPYAHSVYYGFIPTTLLFDTLITKDADGAYAPELATEWEFIDDLTLRVKLREGVTFHNGNPLTADDVKYTLKVASESSFSSTLFACIDNDATAVIDDLTLDIKLKYAYAPLLEVLSSFRASIVDKETYEADPDSYARNPVGTGPMQMSNWFSGDRIELTAFDHYWGDATCLSDLCVPRDCGSILPDDRTGNRRYRHCCGCAFLRLDPCGRYPRHHAGKGPHQSDGVSCVQ